MYASRYRRQLAESITARAIELAHDIQESDEFINECLCLIKRAIGFETAFAGGPALGRSIIADEASAPKKSAALASLRGSGTRYGSILVPVFTRSFDKGVCLDTEFYPTERERMNSTYYHEILRPAEVRSLACLSLSWRGVPLAFIVAARHEGRAFSEAEAGLFAELKPALETALMANLSSNKPTLGEKLSPREREIAELICRGLSNREIAAIFGTSPHTVRNQSVQIYRKLDVDGRVELTAALRGKLELATGAPAVMGWLSGFA